MDQLEALHRRIQSLEEQLSGLRGQVKQYGLEVAFNTYYGVYRAQVVRNDDPEQRGRIQITCPEVGDTIENFPDAWVDPAFHGAGTQHGAFAPPEVGDSVRVAYSSGNSGKPIVYWGGWYGQGDMPAEFAYTAASGRPERRGFVTKAGHSVTFTDEAGKEAIQIMWHKPDPLDTSVFDPTVSADRTKGKFAFLSFDSNGSILLSNQNGSLINLDAVNTAISMIDQSGNSITTDSDGIKLIDKNGNVFSLDNDSGLISVKSNLTLTGAGINLKTGAVFLGEPAAFSAVIGEELITYLASHVHPVAPGAPASGPPLVPPPPTLLSQSVKLKK